MDRKRGIVCEGCYLHLKLGTSDKYVDGEYGVNRVHYCIKEKKMKYDKEYGILT